MNDPHRVGAKIPGPTLLRLIQQKRYSEAVVHFRERPHDVLYINGVGKAPLYQLCCEEDCTEEVLQLIEEILKGVPRLAKQARCPDGDTPMHQAAGHMNYQKGETEANERKERRLLLLIQAVPEGVNLVGPKWMGGHTVLSLVCKRNASARVLKAILKINPSLATQPIHNQTDTGTNAYPLFMLWKSTMGLDGSGDWSRMEILLRAATGAPLEDHERDSVETTKYTPNTPERFDVLRAACMANPCPRDYIQMLIQRYPNRLSWADEQGLLPLHHAVLSCDKRWPLHTEFLVQAILERYPAAATYPFGKPCGTDSNFSKSPQLLPIHVLIADKEMTWQKGGVKDLVFAYPEALGIPDPRSRLVPALASVPLAIQSRLQLSTTYELLRLSPEIFQNCGTPESAVDSPDC